jgi:hypothetical protein
MRKCTLCEEKHFGRGFCRFHYVRWWQHKDDISKLERPKYQDFLYIPKNIRQHNDYLEVETTKGIYFKIDHADEEKVLAYHWNFGNTGYLQTEKMGKRFYLHRFLMEAGKGEQVDHINGDKLDNRRANLRICTRSQNFYNKGRQSNNTSGYKGVTFCKATKKWRAQIWFNKKRLSIGRYKTKEEAALEYNKMANKYHAEFANLNIIKL